MFIYGKGNHFSIKISFTSCLLKVSDTFDGNDKEEEKSEDLE